MSAPTPDRRASLTVTLWFMAMECAWMAVTLNEMMAARIERPPYLWVLLLYPGAWLYGRIEGRLGWRPWLAFLVRWTVAVLTVSALALWIARIPPLALPGMLEAIDLQTPSPRPLTPLALAAAAAGLAAARGHLLSHRQVDREGFAVAFQVGVVILMAAVFLHQLAGLPDLPIIAGLTGFLGVGLYGLWLCGWQESEVAGRRGERAGWPALTLAAIVAVLAAGAALWSLLDATTMRLLLAPVFWAWEALVRLLAWMLSLLPPPEAHPLPQPLPGAPELPPVKDHPFLDLGETVRKIAGFLFLLSVAALFGAALLRNLLDLLRWLARRGGRAPGVVYEGGAGSLLDDLRDGLAALLYLLRRWRQALLDRFGRSPDPLRPEARAVRALYARLLARAARRGLLRGAGTTPHEFLEPLRAAFPGGGPELAAITEAYAAVRYAEAVPDPLTLRELRAAWRRVRRCPRAKPTARTEANR